MILDQSAIEIIDSKFNSYNREVMIPAVFTVIEELEDYWPLTLRQIYYRCVTKKIIKNDKHSYKTMSRLLTKLRRLEVLSWDTMEDTTRRVSNKRGYEDASQYSKGILRAFDNYDRCLVQGQENYCEIFLEKFALTRIVENIAWRYCVRVVTLRGQSSSTIVQEYSERARAAIDNGQHPVILHFGDLDPSGARIPVSIKDKLKKYHGVSIETKVVAMTPEHVLEYPASIDPLKKSDPNYKWFVRNFGDKAVELDAIHPRDLQSLIKDELAKVLDIEDMLYQQEIQTEERQKYSAVKKQIEIIFKSAGLL